MQEEAGAEEDLDRVAATMDAEVRAEQAAYESMALQAQWRARRLADVARELVYRGDVVEVRAVGRSLTGAVAFAGEDYVVLDTRRGPVDVVLARCELLRVVQRVHDGGRPAGRGARTMRARLTEHETAAVPLRLLVTGEGEVDGTLRAVAVDHLLLDTPRGQVVVPDGGVVAVWPLPVTRPIV